MAKGKVCIGSCSKIRQKGEWENEKDLSIGRSRLCKLRDED